MTQTYQSLVETLKSSIESNDKEGVILVLDKLEEQVAQKNNAELVKWVTEPQNITELHRMLIEHMNVIPRAMMLKTRVPNRYRRAFLFIKAMKNGVNHL